MIMAVQDIPFLYSYTGGMTPETLEVFWLRADGVAEYVTGNSWPQQPPFDEIGHYRDVLPTEDRETLFGLVQEAQRESPPDSTARSLDAGTEFFRACLDQKTIEATWSPSRSPARYQMLSRQTRRLIARTRSAPLSTLRVGFVSRKDGDQVGVTLQNRGREPFVFYDAQEADETLRIEVRVRAVNLEAHGLSSPPNPLLLAHLTPLSVLNASDWRPNASGEIWLNPGTTSCIEIDCQALSLLSTRILEGLVRISFWRATPEGESLREQGWAMPVPIKFGFGLETEKTGP
jgi:hypothetical protein